MKKIGRYALNTLATVIIALLATRWFVRLPIETPIPSLIEAAMSRLGMDVIAHADEIEPIGLLIVLLVSLAVGTVVVWTVNWLLYRARTR